MLEALASIATIVGVPYALFLYVSEKRKQRRERELVTFSALATEYRRFLNLCLQYPELQMYNYSVDTTIQLTDEEKVQQMILFEQLALLLETAYFQYRMHTSEFRKAQWDGWNEYMKEWGRRKDFRGAWKVWIGRQFDRGFLDHMHEIMRDVESEPNR